MFSLQLGEMVFVDVQCLLVRLFLYFLVRCQGRTNSI